MRMDWETITKILKADCSQRTRNWYYRRPDLFPTKEQDIDDVARYAKKGNPHAIEIITAIVKYRLTEE